MIDRIVIGNIIQKLRKDKNLTQEKLAEKIDISTNYLSKVERGLNILNTESFLKMATILEFTLEDFGIKIHSTNENDILKEKLIKKILTSTPNQIQTYSKFITLIDETSIK